MPAVPLDQNLSAGTLISLPVSFYSLALVLRPSDQEILTAVSNLDSFTPSSWSYDLSSGIGLSESGTLYGTVTSDDTGNDIIQQINLGLRSIKTLTGINISEIDTATGTSKKTDTQPSTPIDCTNPQGIGQQVYCTFANVGKNLENTVIIILLILLAGIYFISKSKSIRLSL